MSVGIVGIDTGLQEQSDLRHARAGVAYRDRGALLAAGELDGADFIPAAAQGRGRRETGPHRQVVVATVGDGKTAVAVNGRTRLRKDVVDSRTARHQGEVVEGR